MGLLTSSLNEDLMKKLSALLVWIHPEIKASQKKTIHKWNSSKKEKYLAIARPFISTFLLSVGDKTMCNVENIAELPECSLLIWADLSMPQAEITR